MDDPNLWQTLGQLVTVLGQLTWQLLELASQWLLLIIWVAWWLLAVDWRKAWPTLRAGAWAPVVLLMVIVALAWSRLEPPPAGFAVRDFAWRLVYVAVLVAVALFCGWLQGVLRWMPPAITLEPPAHEPVDGHVHGAHH
jgi:hypothetical protein